MLKLKNVSLDFRSPDHIQVLHDVNITLKPNKLYAIVGHNACGKTTLLNTISGVEGYTNYTGSITVENCCIDQLNRRKRARSIFKIDQNVLDYLVPHFSVYEHLFLSNLAATSQRGSFFVSSKNRDVKKTIATSLNDLKIDLNPYFKKLIYQLNGGHRQQVALSCLFVRKPKVALLDEPSASLDPENSIKFHEILYKLTPSLNAVILVVSHDIPIITKYSDYIVIMSKGEIIEVIDNEQKNITYLDVYKKMGLVH